MQGSQETRAVHCVSLEQRDFTADGPGAVCVCSGVHVEVKGQHVGVAFLLPGGSQGSDSDDQAWWQAPCPSGRPCGQPFDRASES